jgi:ubiquinone/menaquinone biosynthesis C-methylase UbiE
MDAIGAKPGSVVADVGCGKGYFTFHLAARVGPRGKVYAEDILSDELKSIRERATKWNLPQIETIHGTPSDPRLPAGALDAILVVNAYHEMTEFDSMMSAFFRALKPGAVLAILDARDAPGKARETYQNRHTLPQELVREDAARAGFRFLRELPGYRNPGRDNDFYVLLFEKPAP